MDLQYLLLPVWISALVLIVRLGRRSLRWYAFSILELGVTVGLCALALRWPPCGIAAVALVLAQTLGAQLLMRHGYHRALPLLCWGNDGRFKSQVMAAIDSFEPESADRLRARWLRPNLTSAVRATVLASLAPLYLRLGRFLDCVECYEEAAKLEPGLSAMVYLGRLRPYAELGRWDEVGPCLGQFLELPDARSLLDDLHWTVSAMAMLALSGDLDGLQAFVRHKDAQLRSSPYLVPYWVARCHAVRGETEPANEGFNRCLVLADTEAWRAASRRWLATPEPSRPPVSGMAALVAAAERIQEATGALQVVRLLPGTAAVVLLCCVVWSVEEWAGGSTDPGVLYRMGAFSQSGAAWRWLTAVFLHAGFAHLACNCLGMLLFGLRVESIYGSRKTIVLFLASALLGNVLSLPIVGDNDGVGASGGVMGMLGAVAAAFVRAPGTFPTGVRSRQLKDIAWLLALQFLVDRSIPQVNGTAHIFGAVGGFLLGLALFSARSLRLRRALPRRWFLAGLALALLPGAALAWRNERAEQLLAGARTIVPVQQALGLNPRSFRANLLLGGLKLSDGDLGGCVDAENRALALFPKDAAPYRLLGVALYQQQSFQASLTSCQKALTLAPDDPFSLAFAALDSFCLGDYRAGQQLARDSLRAPTWDDALSPPMVMVLYLCGWELDKRGDPVRLQPLQHHDPVLFELLSTDDMPLLHPPSMDAHPWAADQVVDLAFQRFYQGRRQEAVNLLRLAQTHLGRGDVAFPLAEVLETRLKR